MSIATADGRFDYEGDESHDEWSKSTYGDMLSELERANDKVRAAVIERDKIAAKHGFLSRWDYRAKNDNLSFDEVIEEHVEMVMETLEERDDNFALIEAKNIAYGSEE